MILTEPLAAHRAPTRPTTSTPRIDGGGISGQAGALRLGIARALIELDPELRAALKKAGFLTRDAREKESQEVRPEEGPQGTAVLEALIAGTVSRAASAPTASRGVANAELTAGARRSPSAGPRRGCSVGDRRSLIGRDTRRSGPLLEAALAAGLCAEGVDGRAARRAADPGGGVPRPRRDGVPGGDDLGVAQPVRRQRHQALRRRRPQARRRRRAGGARGRARSAPRRRRRRRGRPGRRSASIAHVDGPRRRRATRRSVLGALDGRRLDGLRGRARLRQRRRVDGRPARAPALGAEVDGAPRRARRAQHQRRLRLDPPRGPAAPRCVDARRRRRASPSTATPTGCWRSTRPGALVDGDQLIAIVRHRPARPAARSRGDTVVVTVMTNLGFRLAMASRRHRRRRDRGRRPLRARGARRAAARPSAASSPAT